MVIVGMRLNKADLILAEGAKHSCVYELTSMKEIPIDCLKSSMEDSAGCEAQ